jgi:hypothetical protein
VCSDSRIFLTGPTRSGFSLEGSRHGSTWLRSGDFFNALAHRLGVWILKALSSDRFQGEHGFAWGCAVVVSEAINGTLSQAIALLIMRGMGG